VNLYGIRIVYGIRAGYVVSSSVSNLIMGSLTLGLLTLPVIIGTSEAILACRRSSG
jgi:ABC-type phosphate transport system permease subunit